MLNIHCMNFFTQQQLLLRQLLGLGNKFGVKIISTTKYPDKEPAFSPINGNSYKFRVFSGVQLIPYIKSSHHYIVVGAMRHLYLQRGS